ncbi:hypothetical protein ASD64_13980 [Mesorhizobium sp. Root157]|uniref:DUF1971 domain-containing protein n=1 Tax=Mesorhizobium sp. Root157 TaxID=1736477 RepID=UPI000701C665|nr:DUF1971 domain-containing protein [Mesorhizobium sp. Root157]KQZ99912.1 hypothetical protein ASD64_13980 [Mesorhizobium sp. Root157]
MYIFFKNDFTASNVKQERKDDGDPDAHAFEAYGRSPEFTPEMLPAKFQTAHATKAGTWGLLHVIEEGTPHHVAFTESGRIFIEFYRKQKSDGA